MSPQVKVTVPDLRTMKREARKITMLTAYDATFARLLDGAGVDVILVGDSLGMVVQGRSTTLKVTVDQMAYHGACVARVLRRALLVVDMPFMSYHVSSEDAVRNAGRLVQEGGAEAVKLEGGAERAATVAAIVAAQIPVVGHIGLTPQSVHVQGGFKVQGRSEAEADRLMADARAIQDAGACALVLEGMPRDLAERITTALEIPTIGIGAGSGCDGQVLVIQDMLGMDPDFQPRFVKRYAEVGRAITCAVGLYVEEVRSGIFPDDDHSFHRRRRATAVRTSAAGCETGYGPVEADQATA